MPSEGCRRRLELVGRNGVHRDKSKIREKTLWDYYISLLLCKAIIIIIGNA